LLGDTVYQFDPETGKSTPIRTVKRREVEDWNEETNQVLIGRIFDDLVAHDPYLARDFMRLFVQRLVDWNFDAALQMDPGEDQGRQFPPQASL
jgi:hypothetical protein